MKITVNKEFTTIAKADTVKNALKLFKSTYSETDVLNWFTETTGEYIAGDILEMKVSGFDGFECVAIMVECLVYHRGICLYDIRFHGDITNDGFMIKINTDELLVNVEKFNRVW